MTTTISTASASPSFNPSSDLFPFESRWLQTRLRGRIHYIDEGHGQPILMCHGNPTWSFLYRHVITGLRDQFRCIALDYPGFGLSQRPAGYGYTASEHADVVTEVIDSLDLRDVIVMGHDWGGPIGLAAACAHSERVGGLILGNTWFWPAERRARAFSKVMSTRVMQRAIVKHNVFVERILPAGVNRSLTAQEIEHYRAVQPDPASRLGVAELPRQITAAEPFLTALAAAVPAKLADTPTLVTFPMRDPGFPAKSVLPRMRGVFYDIEVVELTGAKHFFLEDVPGEVAAAIRERFS